MGTILHVCTGLTNDSRFTAADDRLGLYHFGTAEDVTRLEFASAVRDAIAPAAQVVPVAAADYVTVARRPVYSVLGADKLRQAFNVTLPPWRSQLASVLSAARLGR
jgi:dTDP-4-dehydrorhamnose reductase